MDDYNEYVLTGYEALLCECRDGTECCEKCGYTEYLSPSNLDYFDD